MSIICENTTQKYQELKLTKNKTNNFRLISAKHTKRWWTLTTQKQSSYKPSCTHTQTSNKMYYNKEIKT